MADIIAYTDSQPSGDDARHDASSAYDRLTKGHEILADPGYFPQVWLQVDSSRGYDGRVYQCTLTREEYFQGANHARG